MSSSPSNNKSAAKGPIRPFRKLLAANRSEIAIRIFRAGTELNLSLIHI